jgi:transposase
MKKSSSSRQNPKPVAKAKRAKQSFTIGMDLGDRNSRYCLLSDEGEILEEDQVATTKAGMTQKFVSVS